MAGENPQTTLPPVPRESLIDRSGRISSQWERWISQVQRILSFAGGIAWGIVNKGSSRLSDIETRTHAMLQEVLGWVTGTDTAQVRHISNANGKVWQDHVEIVDGNPHGTDHAMLDAIMVLDTASTDTTQDRHLSDAQGKHWQDHVDNDAQDDHSQYLLLAGRTGQTVTTPLSLGTATDNTTIEANGTVTFNGGATVWKDIKFPMAPPKSTGAGNPTLTTYNGNMRGYAFAVNDVHDFDPQEMDHDAKIGSTATWHVHWLSRSNDGTDRAVKWELEYAVEPANGALPAPTTVSVELTIPAGSAVNTVQRSDISTFTIPAIARLAYARLKRIASAGTSPSVDPILSALHFHYELDTVGSREILTK